MLPPWLRRPGQPRPRIPVRATERVTGLDERGRKLTSEYWLRGQLVGRVAWNPFGDGGVAVGLRNGVPVGYQVEFDQGGVRYAEPFVEGVLHGLAKQFGKGGRLLMVSPFRRGTGTDFWCDLRGRLAEEHPLVAGKPSGTERWWNPDQKTVFSETEWLNGAWHGATRHWSRGRLDPGYPKFFIRDEPVSKRAYLEAAAEDPSLPPYRSEADLPARALPKRFLDLTRRARLTGVKR